MKKKNLAEEYAIKDYERLNGEGEPVFEDNLCFSIVDIEDAFNAGRESVIENIPNMKWIDDLSAIEDFEEVLREECIATTPFGEYSIRYFYYSKTYVLFFADEKVSNDFKLLNDIKLFAEKDYQNRIKKALGL